MWIHSTTKRNPLHRQSFIVNQSPVLNVSSYSFFPQDGRVTLVLQSGLLLLMFSF